MRCSGAIAFTVGFPIENESVCALGKVEQFGGINHSSTVECVGIARAGVVRNIHSLCSAVVGGIAPAPLVGEGTVGEPPVVIGLKVL